MTRQQSGPKSSAQALEAHSKKLEEYTQNEELRKMYGECLKSSNCIMTSEICSPVTNKVEQIPLPLPSFSTSRSIPSPKMSEHSYLRKDSQSYSY